MIQSLLGLFGIHVHKYKVVNKYGASPFYYRCSCGKFYTRERRMNEEITESPKTDIIGDGI